MDDKTFFNKAYELHKLWKCIETELVSICKLAWKMGYMSGWSGNASIRAEPSADAMLITPSGQPKGELTPTDLMLMDFSGSVISGNMRPSSEWNLHARLYEAMGDCQAILHTHPSNLQALDLIYKGNTQICAEKFLDIHLYELAIWKQKLFFVPGFAPGSEELARQTANLLKPSQKVALPLAFWLQGHGLCALGQNLRECLSLTEELEHLAAVQLKYLASD